MEKYKTFEELKDELGDKFKEYMYKANIELLKIIDEAIEYINNSKDIDYERLMLILKEGTWLI